jgi:hypothetical protein
MKIVPETPQEADLAHRRLMAMEHLLGPVTIMQLPHNPDGGGGETRETQECS